MSSTPELNLACIVDSSLSLSSWSTPLKVEEQLQHLEYDASAKYEGEQYCTQIRFSFYSCKVSPLIHSLIHVLEIGDLWSSFLFVMLSGFPRFASSERANFWFARRCWGVCAYTSTLELVFDHGGWDFAGEGRYHFESIERRRGVN